MIHLLWKIIRKVPLIIGFVLFYVKEILLANLRIAYDVLTPRHRMKPGIIAVPLDVRTDLEIITLANLITITPGTMSLDISADRRILYVHAMDINDAEKLRRKIKNGIEKKVLEVMR